MKCFIISLLSLIVCIQGVSQGNDLFGGGAYRLSAGLMNSVSTSHEFIYNNPSDIAWSTKTWGIDIGGIYRYGLSDLATVSLGGFYRKESNNFRVYFTQFGNSIYREQKASFGYSRKLFDNFSLGTALNYHGYQVTEIGNEAGVSIDLGLSAHLSNKLRLNAYAINLTNNATIAAFEIPTALSIGLLYQVGSQASLAAELEKQIDHPISIKIAINYLPVNSLAIRLGADLTRNQLALGIVYTFSGFSAAGAYSVNQILGNSPAVNFSYVK